MARTYDIEWLVADTVKAYLDALLDAATKADHPVVTFYDPMAVDEANRIVVMPESVQGGSDQPASYTVDVNVTVKTRWAEPTLESVDTVNHRAVVSEVRDKLMASALAASLHTYAAGKFAVAFAFPSRQFRMDVNENYLLSEARFSIRCNSIT